MLYLLALPMRLDGGIPGSYRVRRKAVWLTSVHLTHWFLNQQRYIVVPLKSMEMLLWHSAGQNVTFIKTAECNACAPEHKAEATRERLKNNNANAPEWPSQESRSTICGWTWIKAVRPWSLCNLTELGQFCKEGWRRITASTWAKLPET